MDALDALQHFTRYLLIANGGSAEFCEVNGQRIHHYHFAGTGKGYPIMLVHGLASSSHTFARMLPKLTQHFHSVFALDLPGNGWSPLPSSGPLKFLDHMGILKTYLREQVKMPALVVANSLGGALCIRMAAAVPELVKALALIAPAGAQVSEERMAELLTFLNVETNAHARQLTRRLFHRVPLAALLLASDLRRMYSSDAARAVREEAREQSSLEPDVLSKLTMPVLLLWGASEKFLPFEGIEYFKKHMPPHAQIEVVEGFGHVPQFERPKEVFERIIAFAERVK
jgi:pimeloyl-ACP methyl ester carboxylesterase